MKESRCIVHRYIGLMYFDHSQILSFIDRCKPQPTTQVAVLIAVNCLKHPGWTWNLSCGWKIVVLPEQLHLKDDHDIINTTLHYIFNGVNHNILHNESFNELLPLNFSLYCIIVTMIIALVQIMIDQRDASPGAQPSRRQGLWQCQHLDQETMVGGSSAHSL